VRTIVGEDAERNVVRRSAATDEEWAALFALESDDAFFEEWTRLGGGFDPRSVAAEASDQGASPATKQVLGSKQANVR
jgi:hypothetical protein